MANICNGEMRVLGSFESKKKLLDLFLRENSTNKEKVIHFARTWIKLGDERNLESKNFDNKILL